MIKNAQAMASVFIENGYDVVSGGTENHLFLLSLIKQDITGKDADAALGRAFITVNKNSVPNDPRSPFVTSGPAHRHPSGDHPWLQGRRVPRTGGLDLRDPRQPGRRRRRNPHPRAS